MLNKEDIIAIVAKEHQVLITKDDPILSLLIIHQQILDEYAKNIGSTFEEISQQFSNTLEKTQEQFSEKARVLANEVVGKSIKSIEEGKDNFIRELNIYNINKKNELLELHRIYNFIVYGGLVITALLLLNLLVHFIG